MENNNNNKINNNNKENKISGSKEKKEVLNGPNLKEVFKFFNNKIVIHEVGFLFDDLNVPGVRNYIERQLQLPCKIAIFPLSLKPLIEEVFHIYKGYGIGPEKIIFLEDKGEDNNYDSEIFLKKAFYESMDIIADESFGIDGVSLFMVGKEMKEPIISVMSEYECSQANKEGASRLLKNITGVSSEIVPLVNSKLTVRESIRTCGLEEMNPQYFVVDLENELSKERFTEEFNSLKQKISQLSGLEISKVEIILKDPNSASGDGIKKCSDPDEAFEFVNYLKDKGIKKVLVEEVVEIDENSEGSIQFYVGENGVVFLSLTKQIVKNNVHQGNLLSSDPETEVNNQLNKEEINKLVKLALHYYNIGYRGYMGFDFNKKNNRLTVFEANCRITGASYPLAVLSQLKRQNPDEDFTVISTNTLIVPTISNLKDLNDILSKFEILYDPEKKEGVIPTLTSLIPEMHKFGVIVVAKNTERAKEILNRLFKELGLSKSY